ncbi:MAG: TetR/AcrR family transcriptional regulator, partial [Limnobacter sp.]|nr:TetR/AcrR family transcriptional regulator [Limnobacter sp.]
MSYLTERREEEKEKRRQAILDAAELVFEKHGFQAATMDMVARGARVSRALVYVYFKDKEALHLGICLRGLRTLTGMFQKARSSASTGFEQVRAIGQAYMEFSEKYPTRFLAMSLFEAQSNPQEHPCEATLEMLEAGKRVHEQTVLAIVQGKADGSLRANIDDPMQVSITLWAFSHGTIQLAQTKQNFMSTLGI